MPGADQEWPVNFNVVHVNQVFVKISTSHRILRTQLVVARNAGQGFNQRFNTSCPGIRHSVQVFGINPVHVGFVSPVLGNLNFINLLVNLWKRNIQFHPLLFGSRDIFLESFVADQ